MDTNKKDIKKKNINKKQSTNINKKKDKNPVKIKKEKDSNVISLNRKFDSKNLIYTPKLRNTFIVILIIFILLLGISQSFVINSRYLIPCLILI